MSPSNGPTPAGAAGLNAAGYNGGCFLSGCRVAAWAFFHRLGDPGSADPFPSESWPGGEPLDPLGALSLPAVPQALSPSNGSLSNPSKRRRPNLPFGASRCHLQNGAKLRKFGSIASVEIP